MAVSGRKNKPFDSSINRGSAEDYEHVCNPCFTGGQEVEAHGYCVECQDYLCVACFRSHSKSRASRHHELLDKATSVPRNIPPPSPDTCTEKCPKHGREIIKFFCTEHEALGCNDCMILDHRTCKIDYIPDKCVDFARSNKPAGTLENLDDILENVTYVQKMADDKTREINEAYKKAEEDIDKFQKEIHDRIAELRNQIMGDFDKQRQTKRNELNKVLKTCEKVATDVKQIQMDAKNSIATKRDCQVFISSKRAERLLKSVDMWEAEAALKKIISITSFQRSKDVENMFNDQAVLGKISNARIPDTILRQVRDAIITRSKVDYNGLLNIAICIGPTLTECGFYLHDRSELGVITWGSLRSQKVTQKAPTALLINPDGDSVCEFGFDARWKYYELNKEGKHERYYYFESFISSLYKHTDAKETYIQDVIGKKMAPVHVLSLLIGYIKDHALKEMQQLDDESMVNWTITIPERFSTVTNVMEEAAEKAGISSKRLTIAFESEATFMFIQTHPVRECEGSPEISVARFPEGKKYIVLDAGDNMVTSTIYEVGNGKSKQLFHASLDSFGGDNVNKEFEKFFARLFGIDVITEMRKNHLHAFEDLEAEIENKKRKTSPADVCKVSMTIPAKIIHLFEKSTGKRRKDIMCLPTFKGKIYFESDKLRIEAELFKQIFKPAVDGIVDHLRFVLQDVSALECDTIVMVGKFSESLILQEGVKKAFSQVKVVVPMQPDMAVVEGAVILGHSVMFK